MKSDQNSAVLEYTQLIADIEMAMQVRHETVDLSLDKLIDELFEQYALKVDLLRATDSGYIVTVANKVKTEITELEGIINLLWDACEYWDAAMEQEFNDSIVRHLGLLRQLDVLSELDKKVVELRVVSTNRPRQPCFTCNSTNWWLSQGRILCNVCHPEPRESVKETIQEVEAIDTQNQYNSPFLLTAQEKHEVVSEKEGQGRML